MNQSELCRHLGCSENFIIRLRKQGHLTPRREKHPGVRGWVVTFSEADIAKAERLYKRNIQRARVGTSDPLLHEIFTRILARFGTWREATEHTSLHYNHLVNLARGDKTNPTLEALDELANLAGGKITFVEDQQ